VALARILPPDIKVRLIYVVTLYAHFNLCVIFYCLAGPDITSATKLVLRPIMACSMVILQQTFLHLSNF